VPTKAEARALFPVTRNVIYFNHAAVGPLSARAFEAMQKHAQDQRDFGATHWRDWYAEYDLLRGAIARLIGADADEVAILKNTSEGLSFVAEGFPWERGDNVVTTAFEFTSNYTPWKRLEERGVECRVATLPTVEEIDKCVDERTRIVTVSSVAFHNGFAADLDAIGEFCAGRGVLFCVDAIQSVGALPIDVRRSKIAFLAADGHKWMCGPEGCAIFFVAEEHRERLRVMEMGWTNVSRGGRFINVDLNLVPSSRRFEAGSINTNGVYALHEAIELLLEIGVDTIGVEVRRLAERLASQLEAIGWRVETPRPAPSGIIGATPPSVEPSLLRWHRTLEENGVITAPREGMIRFSPHFYNEDSEIERVIEVLKKG
jgi:selenocysteine lyase/cysteine desulfurase